MELCRHLLVGRWNSFCLTQSPLTEFNYFILSLSFQLIPFAFLLFLIFSISLLQREHPNNPGLNGLLCSAAAESALSFFCLPALRLYSHSAGDWLQHWTMTRLCMQAHTQQKNTTMGRRDHLPCTAVTQAPPSLFFMCHFLIKQPVSPIGGLTQHPHWRDVSRPQLHSGLGRRVWDAVNHVPPQRCTNSNTSSRKPASFICSNYRLKKDSRVMKSGCRE